METISGMTDWFVFVEATRAFLSGASPYAVQLGGNEWYKVFEPPWTYMFLAPFAMLPFWTGRTLVLLAGICVFGVSSIKMGANRWQIVMFMLSHPVIGGLHEGNIDWLVTAGLWMPPQFGLFFVLMKPQIGFGVAVYWAYMAWRKGGVLEVVKVFAPVTIAYLISFDVYGFWVSNAFNMHNNPVNISLFPFGVVLGVALVVIATQRKEQNLAAIGSPFLAPYLTLYNFSGSLLSMFDRPRLFITAWILLWIPTLIRILIL